MVTMSCCKKKKSSERYQPAYRSHLVASPPPEPPGEQPGPWELQYCNLYGWTWVRRGDKQAVLRESQMQTRTVQEIEKKKKKKCYNCFKRKPYASEELPPDQTVLMAPGPAGPPPPQQMTYSAPMPVKSEASFRANNYQEEYEQPCYCCCCNECCCMVMCCPCCNGDLNPAIGPEKCVCKNATTQTHRDIKETATTMSRAQLAKAQPRRAPAQVQGKCRPQKMVCVRAVCCPCVQNACCPCCQCVQNNGDQNQNSGSRSQRNQEDQDYPTNDNKQYRTNDNMDRLINLCLTDNLCKPNLGNVLNYKSKDFSTLHKSLDILLKNNTHIMNLINENKELKRENKTPNFLDLNHCISSLTLDNNVKKTDDEHCRLLTAVCDAILSSHKFDNEGYQARRNASFTSVGQDSLSSVNARRHTGHLERLLSGLNFSNQKAISTEQCNIAKEIGVQVNNNPVKKTNRYLYSTRPGGRIPKNRNRTLTNIARIFKKSDILRNFKTDPLAISHNTSSVQTQKNDRFVKTDAKSSSRAFRCDNPSQPLFLPLNFTPQNSATANKGNTSSQTPNLEQLLASVNFNFSNNVQNPTCSSAPNDVNISIQHRHNAQLLEDTSPPFTDFDSHFLAANKEDANPEGEKHILGDNIFYK